MVPPDDLSTELSPDPVSVQKWVTVATQAMPNEARQTLNTPINLFPYIFILRRGVAFVKIKFYQGHHPLEGK